MKIRKQEMTENSQNIEQLYDKYSRRLFFTSLRITGDNKDAEEVMQDSFIKYFKYDKKNEIINIESWLLTICVRQSIDAVRKRTLEINFLEDYFENEYNSTETSEPIAKNLTNEELIENIKKKILALPDTLRIIISLRLIEGYDYEEIQQITGLNCNTIRSRFIRGKVKLIELLNED